VFAMVATAPHRLLEPCQRTAPLPEPGEVLLRIEACGVCRTDLHLVDGELPQARYPVIPGHEVVGVVEACGPAVDQLSPGDRVGVPWLGGACGHCRYCREGRENLCDTPAFTGCTRDGGFATHMTAKAAFCLPLPAKAFPDAAAASPLLCAGLIGARAWHLAGEAQRVGLYGFGAAAHILAQFLHQQGREVNAFTRPGDVASQRFARELGAQWAGGSDEPPPALLDAAIIFAASGELVPVALAAVRKGGSVICGGIHMSDIPAFPYRLLWEERRLLSVANLTRSDGHRFLREVVQVPIRTQVTTYALKDANRALDDLRHGRLHGAAVLLP
jgi:alcohol dehydrogenase, propanol-preferring